MKKLSELYDIQSDELIKDIKINSKEVKKGDLFVCTMGVNADRHDFIDDAIKNGASAIVVSKDNIICDVPVIKVNNTNEELPLLCARYYDNPDKKLNIIGVTGTDGKTTIATIIQTLIGKNICGYIGTNGVTCANYHEHLINTTPDVNLLYKYFDIFVNKKCKYVSMEASSEAFLRNRLSNIMFDVSIYTNISNEHMNVHKTFDNYLECKLQLFRQTKKDGYCIINRDDKYYDIVCKNCNGKILSYGENKESDLRIVSYELFADHTNIKFSYKGKEFDVTSPLLALFNIYNLAAALLVCLSLGFNLEDILVNIDKLKIEGRVEVLKGENYTVIVDFAHTPHAIDAILSFSRSLSHNKIITVIGSAGGRDQEKRPVIGDVCIKKSDYVIFTTDDPRNEDPLEICNMMIGDLKNYYDNFEIILDRKRAVKKAIDMAEENDIVLLLCKGNEPYQITSKGYEPYNEIMEAKKAIEEKKSQN